MAEGISVTLKNEILGILLGTSKVAPAQYHVGLLKAPPPETGDCTGIEFLSADAPGYARKIFACDAVNWESAANRTITNARPIYFDPATTGPWISPVGVALFRDGTTAIADFYGTVDEGTAINIGDRLKFRATELALRYTRTQQRTSVDFANQIMNILRRQNIAAPNSVFLAFGLKEPTSAGDIMEISGGTYERFEIACNSTNWLTPTTGETDNLVELELPWEAHANMEIKSVAAYTQLVGGSPLWFAPIASKSLRIGDNLRLPQASIKFRV